MKMLIAGLLSALIFWAIPVQAKSPANLNNSVTSHKKQTVQAKANEPKPAETPPVQEPSPQPPKVTEPEPPVSTPKDIAKATLEDLGQGDAWYAVEFIGFKESSWNPHAINNIGACGLFQALPCSKMPCDLSDVSCQVRWATEYATQRYGSWHNAYSFWKKNNWW